MLEWDPVPLSFYQSVALLFLFPSPSVAYSQQLESVSGKTLLVVHALWDKVATTSITTDRGVVGRRHRAQQSELTERLSVIYMHYCVLHVPQGCFNRPVLWGNIHLVLMPKWCQTSLFAMAGWPPFFHEIQPNLMLEWWWWETLSNPSIRNLTYILWP